MIAARARRPTEQRQITISAVSLSLPIPVSSALPPSISASPTSDAVSVVEATPANHRLTSWTLELRVLAEILHRVRKKFSSMAKSPAEGGAPALAAAVCKSAGSQRQPW